MLKGAYDETTLSKALLDTDDLLTSGNEILEAEQEILTYVMRNQNNGERTSIEEIVRNFGRRPYGWYPMAVLTLVSRLFRMGKVELRTTELLDARSAWDHLKNTRQHGSVRVRLQEQFDATKINALKAFHHDFFDRVNNGTDARSVGQFTSEALAAESRDLSVLLDQTGRYRFLEPLGTIAERLSKLAERDYTFLLNQLDDFADELLTAKDDLLSPIKAFMHGPSAQPTTMQWPFSAKRKPILQNFRRGSPTSVTSRSQRTPIAGMHYLWRRLCGEAKRDASDLLTNEREQAISALDAQEGRLKTIDEYLALDEPKRQGVLAVSLPPATQFNRPGL
jgi:hypothetical protein